MPIIVRTVWKTQNDAHVCPICKALEGYSWILSPLDSFPKQLVHPFYGPVYDMRPAASGSLVKKEEGHMCRCSLKHQFEASSNSKEDNGNQTKTTNEASFRVRD